VRAVSLWDTHLNLPRVRFKRCGGSKQAVLREASAQSRRQHRIESTQSIEKLFHMGEDHVLNVDLRVN